MGKLPYGILDITDEAIVFSKEYLEHHLDTCKFAAKRAKEQGDNESFSYFKGRAGVFSALLEQWKYQNKEEEK